MPRYCFILCLLLQNTRKTVVMQEASTLKMVAEALYNRLACASSVGNGHPPPVEDEEAVISELRLLSLVAAVCSPLKCRRGRTTPQPQGRRHGKVSWPIKVC